MRYNFDRTDVSSNATEVAQAKTNNVMMYPSGLLMAKAIRLDVKTNEIAYTKHYYIGSERVSAKTGTMRQLGGYDSGEVNAVFPTLVLPAIVTASNTAVNDADSAVIAVHNKFDVTPNIASIADPERCDLTHDTSNNRLSVYYIHSDHLGSSSYITGQFGNVIQHVEYLPFGETLVDEHTNSFNSPFKFNGKEHDEETGNYYYSARYYDPKWSIFTSVDPLAEKYPNWSSYSYCYDNPVNFIDPTGMEGDDWIYLISSQELIYDEKITTQSEATEKYGKDAQLAPNGGKITHISGLVTYDLKSDGTVYKNGEQIDVGDGYETTGGHTISVVDYPTESSNQVRADAVKPTFVKFAEVLGGIGTITEKVKDSKIGDFLRSGREASKGITNFLKIGGNITGGIGIVNSVVQYANGEISTGEFITDTAFGVAGFCPPLAVVSLGYTIFKSTYEYSTGKPLFEKPLKQI